MDNDLPSTFKVVFFGVLQNSQNEEAVMARFKLLFNIEKPSTLEHLFSGNMVVLKSGLNHEEASTYQAAISKAGAECSIEPDKAIGKFSGTDIDYQRKKKRLMSSMSPQDLSNVDIEPIT